MSLRRDAQRSNRSRQKPQHARRRHMRFESLEVRNLMATGELGTPPTTPSYSSTTDTSLVEIMQKQLTRAFERVSDLSTYASGHAEAADQWVLNLENASALAQITAQLGATALEATPLISNTFIYTVAATANRTNIGSFLQNLPGVRYAYPLVNLEHQARAIPNDPFYSQQWHLNNVGQTGGVPGEDGRLQNAWNIADGSGVVIGIVDDGVQHTHPDLAAHYLAALARDFVGGDFDPAGGPGDFHGTAVAGVANAVTNNNVGVAGAAPDARFTGLRLLGANMTDATQAQAITYMNQAIHIYNNSWGPTDLNPFFGSYLSTPGPLMTAALQSSILTGRGQLGSIQVWAGGNGGNSSDNSNYDGYANSWYTIAIGAIDHAGNRANYSEPGANILVVTQSQGASNTPGITTTDIIGADGYNDSVGGADGDLLPDLNYTSTFNGTSSAAPLASGIIATILEANPTLTWRDVQHVLVNSARKNDPTDPDWTVNGAGHDINHNYGFGAIDAAAAVSLASVWTPVAASTTISQAVNVNQAIPNGTGDLTFTFDVTSTMTIEQIELMVNITHANPEQLEIIVQSPSGTQSVLHDDLTLPALATAGNMQNWSFSSVRHWGENAAGTWTVIVRDTTAGASGQFVSMEFNAIGTAQPASPAGAWIAGQVWNDANSSGAFETGEQPRTGITVYIDANANGVHDAGELSTITNHVGVYAFRGLSAGTYIVNVVTPNGTTQTAPGTGVHIVTVADNQYSVGHDFGIQGLEQAPPPPPPFFISGTVSNDFNLDGVQSPGEPGIPNAIVYLDLNGDGKLGLGEPAQTTNSRGEFNFAAAPGSYVVRQAPLAGWVPTGPTGHAYSVSGASGDGVFNLYFGNGATVDFGDAPAPYPTLAAHGGPSHSVLPGMHLGYSVDGEGDGQPHSKAQGDDNSLVDDDDGVTFLSPMTPGQNATVQVIVQSGGRATGRLNGWIDFNGDGDWNDAGEQVFKDLAVTEGVNVLSFPVPAGAKLGNTFGRFRYGYGVGILPTGNVLGGEVEDYMLAVVGPKPIATPDVFDVGNNSVKIPLDVLANDIASSLGAISILSVSAGSRNGTIAINPIDNTLLYTPVAGTLGIETFTYTITDFRGGTATAQVTVNLVAPFIHPIAMDDQYSVAVNSVSNYLHLTANDLVPGEPLTSLTVAQQTSQGGYVAVNANTLTVRYTPPVNFTGVDQFQYTVRDARGLQSTATVIVRVGDDTADDVASLKFSITDTNGAPLTEVNVGDEFQLHVMIEDIRNTPADPGILSAYLDVLYSQGLIAPKSTVDGLGFEVAFATDFDVNLSGNATQAGLINEVGASRSTPPTAAGPERLLSITFVALAAGQAKFIADPADLPSNRVQVGTSGISVPLDRVTYGTTSLSIVASGAQAPQAPASQQPSQQFKNSLNAYDVNGDRSVTPLDALLVINHLNSIGTHSLTGMSRGNAHFIDVSGDDQLTPLDALLIINFLNAKGSTQLVSGEDDSSPIEAATPLDQATSPAGVQWLPLEDSLSTGASDNDGDLSTQIDTQQFVASSTSSPVEIAPWLVGDDDATNYGSSTTDEDEDLFDLIAADVAGAW